MSAYPIIGICGSAGSGKDTCAEAIGKVIYTQNIALADSMKRFAARLFGFTRHQLWGPSEARNTADPQWTPEVLAREVETWERLEASRQYIDEQFLPDVLPDWMLDHEDALTMAALKLRTWYYGLIKEALRRGELTPRLALQTFGTEWGRHVDQDIWVRYTLRKAEQLLKDPNSGYERTLGVVPAMSCHPEAVVITDVRFRNEVLAIRKAGGQVWHIVPPAKSIGADAAAATAKAGAGAAHASEAEQNSIPEWWFDVKLVNSKAAGLAELEGKVRTIVDQELRLPTQVYATGYYFASNEKGGS